jgi:hypothetical protein
VKDRKTQKTKPAPAPDTQRDRRVLHGLACEWQTALDMLDPIYRRSMQMPLFSIREMNSRWGYWSDARHEICLSRRLVDNYSWDCVREVLLHETAHQLAGRVFGASASRPHGPEFQRACRVLGANSRASGSYAPLHDRVFKESTSQTDSVVRRIQKLLALAESRNPHEANAAMAKAHALIVRYNIDWLEHRNQRRFVSVFLGSPALRHPREDYLLANFLQEFYFVYGLWIPAYVLDRGKMGRVLEISGTSENASLAAYAFDVIKRYMDCQWRQYNRTNRLKQHRRSDFAAGIIEGFATKLRRQMDLTLKDSNRCALVKTTDPQLACYVAEKYPRVRTFHKKIADPADRVFHDGIQAGRNLILSKAVTHEKSTKVQLRIEN